jgi:hypothetical protein
VNLLKYVVVNSSVVWLHILLVPYWCMCGTLFGMRLILNSESVKIHRCDYFGGVAAYFISSLLVYVWCTLWNETHSEQ